MNPSSIFTFLFYILAANTESSLHHFMICHEINIFLLFPQTPKLAVVPSFDTKQVGEPTTQQQKTQDLPS